MLKGGFTDEQAVTKEKIEQAVSRTLDVNDLKASRNLIREPHWWCVGEEAKDINGIAINPESPQAACWCAIGSIKKIAFDNNVSWVPMYNALLDHLPKKACGLISNLNDFFGHSEVIDLFDVTINSIENS